MQASREYMLRMGASMLDLSMGEQSDGETAGLLESVDGLDDDWRMDEGDDRESQKRQAAKGGSEEGGRNTSYGEAGVGRGNSWLRGPRAGLQDLRAVSASR